VSMLCARPPRFAATCDAAAAAGSPPSQHSPRPHSRPAQRCPAAFVYWECPSRHPTGHPAPLALSTVPPPARLLSHCRLMLTPPASLPSFCSPPPLFPLSLRAASLQPGCNFVQARPAHEMLGTGGQEGVGFAVRRDRGRDAVDELWGQPAGPVWVQLRQRRQEDPRRDVQRGQAAHPGTVSTLCAHTAVLLWQ
jgi:hypothetical protein